MSQIKLCHKHVLFLGGGALFIQIWPCGAYQYQMCCRGKALLNKPPPCYKKYNSDKVSKDAKKWVIYKWNSTKHLSKVILKRTYLESIYFWVYDIFRLWNGLSKIIDKMRKNTKNFNNKKVIQMKFHQTRHHLSKGMESPWSVDFKTTFTLSLGHIQV